MNNTPKYTTTYFIQPSSLDIFCSDCARSVNNLTPTQFTYDPATHACDAFCSNCDIAIYDTIQ